MKIFLDESSYLSLKTENKNLILSIKTKDEEGKTLVLSAKLDAKKVEDITAKLISMKRELV
jgi:hypothetical protein